MELDQCIGSAGRIRPVERHGLHLELHGLGCYGYERETSPIIDGIAAEGALFEQHTTSAPWTLPAHAALFTSVPDSVHGVVDPINTRLSDAYLTMLVVQLHWSPHLI